MKLFSKPINLLGALALVLVLVGCNTPTTENTEATPEVNTEATSETGAVDVQPETETPTETEGEATGEVREIQVEAGSFYYEPDVIRVKRGETVRIVMNSVDMMHDFNIDELDVQIPVTQAGNTATVEFTANQVGEFEYYCSVGQHRSQGQVGTLIVEE